MTIQDPVYTTSTPAEYEAGLRERLQGLGCSPAYIEAAVAEKMPRVVQVKNSHEANNLQRGRDRNAS